MRLRRVGVFRMVPCRLPCAKLIVECIPFFRSCRLQYDLAVVLTLGANLPLSCFGQTH